jgi:hypothetical protein
MIPYTDLSFHADSAYKLAELINGGHYTNIFYYEFHEEVDPDGIYNCLEGLEGFKERAQDFNEIFICHGYIDELPARIHIALKVADEWFISHECGSNFYGGFGPTGIIKLREACAKNNIMAFAPEDNFDNWIKKKFRTVKMPLAYAQRASETKQFEKICKTLGYFTVDIQRRAVQFKDVTEENVRDIMLVPLNTTFKGRGHAESKSRKGKTDIVIRTKEGLNEHIFELKVWKGIKTLSDAIEQLLGYVCWHNDHCGIIMFNHNKNFTSILQTVETYLKHHHNFDKKEQKVENEFRFKLKHQTDNLKFIQTHLILVNLNAG